MAAPKFSDDVVNEVLTRIVEGESLRKICRDSHTPATSTWLKWVSQDEELAEQYARAMDQRAEAMFEDILDISDNKTDDVQRDRLRVDARKWMLGKMKPKKYGDKLALEHDVSDNMAETLNLGRQRASKRTKPES